MSRNILNYGRLFGGKFELTTSKSKSCSKSWSKPIWLVADLWRRASKFKWKSFWQVSCQRKWSCGGVSCGSCGCCGSSGSRGSGSCGLEMSFNNGFEFIAQVLHKIDVVSKGCCTILKIALKVIQTSIDRRAKLLVGWSCGQKFLNKVYVLGSYHRWAIIFKCDYIRR